MRTLTALLLALLSLTSCYGVPYGHWGSYGHWTYNCPDFPSYDEVERVLQEHEEIFEKLKEEELIWSADPTECPQGAFITIYHGGEWQIEPALQIMDDVEARTEGLKRILGIPFRFLNV